MNRQDESSPYMSDGAPGFSEHIFGPFGLIILLVIGLIIYYYYNTKHETFINAGKRDDPQADDDYLETQIDLLNRQQYKNIS